jgi:hypothetical protein
MGRPRTWTQVVQPHIATVVYIDAVKGRRRICVLHLGVAVDETLKKAFRKRPPWPLSETTPALSMAPQPLDPEATVSSARPQAQSPEPQLHHCLALWTRKLPWRPSLPSFVKLRIESNNSCRSLACHRGPGPFLPCSPQAFRFDPFPVLIPEARIGMSTNWKGRL